MGMVKALLGTREWVWDGKLIAVLYGIRYVSYWLLQLRIPLLVRRCE